MIGDTYRLKIGDFNSIIFCDMEEHFPLGQILPSIPVEEIGHELTVYGYDPQNIDFSMNLLLIETPEGRTLVDTGLPNKQDLPKSLKAAGIVPESIDRVILTHTDGDHIGGIAYTDNTLTYPNARYSISKAAWEFGMSEAHKSENPNPIALRSLTAIQNRVDVVEGEADVLSGIHVLPAPGHRLGHMAVLVESNGEFLLHIADAAHHPIQVIHPQWSPRVDFQPDASAGTRQALFERALAENLLMMAYHFPFPGLGYVAEQNSKLHWKSVTL